MLMLFAVVPPIANPPEVSIVLVKSVPLIFVVCPNLLIVIEVALAPYPIDNDPEASIKFAEMPPLDVYFPVVSNVPLTSALPEMVVSWPTLLMLTLVVVEPVAIVNAPEASTAVVRMPPFIVTNPLAVSAPVVVGLNAEPMFTPPDPPPVPMLIGPVRLAELPILNVPLVWFAPIDMPLVTVATLMSCALMLKFDTSTVLFVPLPILIVF